MPVPEAPPSETFHMPTGEEVAAAIEAELARLGQSGGRAAERANFATRAVKVARPRAELFAEWQRIGHEHHWSAKELSWMIDAAFPARRVEWERAAAVVEQRVPPVSVAFRLG